jgi:hypothetical protein
MVAVFFLLHIVISNSAQTSFGEQSRWRYEFLKNLHVLVFIMKMCYSYSIRKKSWPVINKNADNQ